MKKLLLLILFAPQWLCAQNYIAKGDSCYKAKDYACAGTNYDLYLKIDDSNGIAYRSALSWSLAGDKDRALAAIRSYVRCNYANGTFVFSKQLMKDKNFDFLKAEPQWKTILARVQAKERQIAVNEKKKLDSVLGIQRGLENQAMLQQLNFEGDNAQTAYQKIRHYDRYPAISEKYLSLQFQITDSAHTAFLVVMPPDYDPRRSYAVLFFLHGAVSSNRGYLDMVEPRADTGGWNRFYTKYAGEVIMVYPHGGKDYNWMYPDDGFFMVPGMLKQIKQIIHVDDDRVFVTGHSNGATGSFSYLMKEPSPFAAFYGFNTRPRVETGGTYIRNMLNRSYFNVSTDNDYYYPPGANDSLAAMMKRMGADYQDHRYNGFPHWFPQFDESEPAYRQLFADLAKRKRDPFHPHLYWECDDLKYGRCDWMQITMLDTLASRAPWQKDLNFEIRKWVVSSGKDKFTTRDTLLQAYKYRKSSGAVKAVYKNNVFTVETSGVKSFRILLSPEMVDMGKEVLVIVNGKLYFRRKVAFDKDFMLKEFENTADRTAIWVNRIDVRL
jgi:pimeloyl-ACP methyl ester carboxylesterase